MHVVDVRPCQAKLGRCCLRSCCRRTRCVIAAASEYQQGRPSALVVGAGVIGLTSAIRLLQLGFDTHVVAHRRAQESVSFGAGAIWELPPFKASPVERSSAWALVSRDIFDALKHGRGVFQRRTHYLYTQQGDYPADKSLTHKLRDFHAGNPPQEVGSRYVYGYSHIAPIIDMPTYLPFLQKMCGALGGRISYSAEPVATLHDASTMAARSVGRAVIPDVVVNCCGLGAATLGGVADSGVIPVRGIKVYVDAPDVKPVSVYIEEPRDASTSFTSITPRGDTGMWACSGVAQPGATSLDVTQEEIAAIMERCTDLLPALKGKPVVGTWAGLRPLRQASVGGIRLEADRMEDGTLVVHNYGHGGAGVVTSWGCAQDVGALAVAEARARQWPLQPLTSMPHDFADVPLPRTRE